MSSLNLRAPLPDVAASVRAPYFRNRLPNMGVNKARINKGLLQTPKIGTSTQTEPGAWESPAR